MPDRINRLLRFLFFAVVARFLVLIVLGVNVRRREQLPSDGPAIVVANHNSHLDTLVLMTLLPLRLLPKLRPVAAADYFLRNRAVAWFGLNIIGILPLQRKPAFGEDPLGPCVAALERGSILILYPEGTRGEPERMAKFRTGIAHLAARCPQAPTIPVFMYGLGKALPKGEALLVPFFCDVFVGEPLGWAGTRAEFMARLDGAFRTLQQQAAPREW
jgi:1-acyl-sn-glycerol-3-phosphate acyltransferase